MEPTYTLQTLVNTAKSYPNKFKRSGDGVSLSPDDERRYRGFVREIIDFLTDYVTDNSYRSAIVNLYEEGRANFLSQVSFNAVTDVASELEALLKRSRTNSAIVRKAPESKASVHREIRILISHGKYSPALKLLQDFISALGMIPVVVVEQPNAGLAVNEKVEHHLNQCQTAIILATGDDDMEGESKRRPRQNVIHEIGLCQQKFGGRIILLLEDNAQLPSNIAPIVYTSFSNSNLTNAFIAVVKDLRNFNLM